MSPPPTPMSPPPAPVSPPPTPVLRAEHLTVRAGGIPLVDDVNLTLGAGERVGLIGESGSGKSLTALSLLGLLPEGLTASGSVQVGGRELVGAGERQAAAVRGRQIAMVFQEPMSALNPAMRVGDQVAEAMLIHHTRPNARAAARAAINLLDQVRLPDPASLARAYPHQLSGGQRQRVVLAIALANDPDVLLCDEPTTALDVTVAAAILDLIVAGVTARKSALLFITHDLAVVARTCQRVLVMYGGRIVEAGEVADVFTSPRHRYTQGLLAASDLDTTDERGRLAVIPGNVPPAGGFPSGCVFRDRCGYATEECAIRPGWSVEGPGRGHACIHPATGRPAPLQTPERGGAAL